MIIFNSCKRITAISCLAETTSRKSQYRLRLEQGAINTEKWAGSDENGVEHDMVDIEILGIDGSVVDRYLFSGIDEPSDHSYLLKLHDAARRNALKVDEMISKLLGEIEKKVP